MADPRHDSVTAPGAPPLAYTQAGAGADVVLIHGSLMTRADLFMGLADSLVPEFRVTAFDRPGQGESGREGPTGTPWRQAAALHAAAQSLGLQRPVLVGHSFGGAVALAWAMQFPEDLRGVVALAPIAFPEVRLEHLLFAPRSTPIVGPLMNETLAAGIDKALLPILWSAMFKPQAIPERFASTFPFNEAGSRAQVEADGEDAAFLNAGLMLSTMNYPACRTPVRIFGGGADLVVNNNLHGKLLARLLPDGKYTDLEGLGHMVHHFAQAPIAEAVRDLAGR
ncbi:alpha/beta fold hydrolase [Phenylobacterium deserti]|uniref:Alpha/beta hydrolase n=1 Tax=Phenylobacterium deserti TaxID=1914756 RepID=A0A328AQW4_9CAUL|nr:alpha/beta hydrolase [Phenylobacterium deserti]RAK56685.1 alpha/beta hydrolase [Phenylobacterium deserti]